MRHAIDPTQAIMGQLRAIGLPEHLPYRQFMVYRFLDADGDLLYVGITCAPGMRWGAHRRAAAWWPLARSVLVEWHQNERLALDAELAAIKAEQPRFNVRSTPRQFMQSAATPHNLLMRNVPLSLSRSLSRSKRTSKTKLVSHHVAANWSWSC